MKLFRDKNRGPKIKEEDVVIPEAYLEYEREQEEKKRQEARNVEAKNTTENTETDTDTAQAREIDAEIDAFKARLDSMMNPRSNEFNEERESETIETDTAGTEAPLEITLKRPTRQPKEDRKSARSDAIASKPSEKKKQRKESLYPPQFKAFLAVIVVAVATFVVLLGPVMAIDQVEVNDLKYISEDKVIEVAGYPVGQNLFRFNGSRAEEELLKYPYVEKAKISRHFPHRLEINIIERQPAGVLLNNSNYLQFSKDGILLDNTKSLSNLGLPLITGFKMEDVPAPGGAFKDNACFKDILRIINACNDDLLRMLQEINIKDRNNILAYTSQGIEIRIGSVDNIEVRMATLNDIINQVILSGIIEEPIEAIDIRYEKSPVVVLEGYSNIDVSDMVDQQEEGESIQEKNDRANLELEQQENAAHSSEGVESGDTGQSGVDDATEPNQAGVENTDSTNNQ